jgi:hypothetical protein
MAASVPNVLVVVTTDVGPRDLALPEFSGANVRVIAPLTQLSRLEWLTNDEQAEREAAARRADRLAEQVAPEAEREVSGSDDVALAIEDALRTFDADEIVLVTSPDADESWLEQDAESKAAVAFDRPVTRIVVRSGGSGNEHA